MLNPRFDEKGSRPGEALGWLLSSGSSLIRLGAFEDLELGELGIERFNWASLAAALYVPAVFDIAPTSVEAFEEWPKSTYRFELLELLSEASSFGVEDFDWIAPAVWRSLWSELAPSEIDPATDTDFTVPGYVVDWASITESAASFAGPVAVEIFDAWAALP